MSFVSTISDCLLVSAVKDLEAALQNDMSDLENNIEQILTQGSQALISSLASVFPDQLVSHGFIMSIHINIYGVPSSELDTLNFFISTADSTVVVVYIEQTV